MKPKLYWCRCGNDHRTRKEAVAHGTTHGKDCGGGKVQWRYLREDPDTCSACGSEVGPWDYTRDPGGPPYTYTTKPHAILRETKTRRFVA